MPRLRKLTLLVHVASSVGWLGSVVFFLALAIVGLTSDDAETVRGAYLVMEPAAWYVLVPFAIASLLTGLLQSLTTAWGLIRHYWVVFKLLINVAATVILLVYTATLDSVARVASDPSTDIASVRNVSPLLHAVLALILLLVAMTLAIYKPRGLTWYGQRTHRRREV
jgi:uncharacterized membrane protein